jgi:hypothetical protein
VSAETIKISLVGGFYSVLLVLLVRWKVGSGFGHRVAVMERAIA